MPCSGRRDRGFVAYYSSVWVIFVRHDVPRPTADLPSTAQDRPANGSASRNDEPHTPDRFIEILIEHFAKGP
jgi:hypothetical protein